MLKNKTARRIKDIPGFVFPGGVRVIINFTVDFDAMIFRKFLREPKLWCAQGEFGGRTGLWRLLDVFGEFDVRTTLFLPGQTGLLYPEVLRRAVREGHEIANHMWDHHIPPTLEEEAVHIDRTDTLIKGLTGQYPAGTRSEHDLAALRDHAYTYVSYTPQGEFPFYVYYENIGKWMLNLPISFIHDDAMFFYFGWFGSRNEQQRIQSPEAFLQTLLEAYAAARETTGYMNIVIHPHLCGRLCRLEMLRRFFRRTREDGDVLFATSRGLLTTSLNGFRPKGRLQPDPGGRHALEKRFHAFG
ncbi:MAG: polysaccharide deacetylase family protein [Bilophila wadsworthia]